MMRRVYGGGVAIILATFLLDIWLPINYELAASWSLTLLALCVSAFTIRYGVWSNWRVNRIGVVLLAKSIFLTITLWQIVASVWIGTDYPHRHQIRFVIYALGALAYSTMVVVLWREQQRDRAALAGSVFDRRQRSLPGESHNRSDDNAQGKPADIESPSLRSDVKQVIERRRRRR